MPAWGNADTRDSSAPSKSVSADHSQILILDSYYYGLPVPDAIINGILATTKKGGVKASDIFIEKLDLIRMPEQEHRAHMDMILRRKLAGKHIGIIIVLGKPAIDFLAREGRDLFPDVPVLSLIAFGGIGALGNGPRKVMNIPWRVDPAGTLRLALDLFPKTQRIFVVTGGGVGASPFLSVARKGFAPWTDKLAIEYADKMTYEEMLQRTSSLPPDAVIIYSSYFTDSTGRSFIPAQVVAEVSRNAAVPVFSVAEQYLGSGIVGGSLVRNFSMGKQAGEIAIDYLNGRIELVAPETTFNAVPRPMFDWRELIRWKADFGRLPKDSLIVNSPPSFWKRYSVAIITGLIVLLALIAATTVFFFQNRRLRKMKNALTVDEVRFRALVECAPEAILVYDMDMKKIVEVNAKAETLFGCNRGTLLTEGPKRFYSPLQPDGKDPAESIYDNMLRAMAGDEVVVERSIRSDDGRELTCEVRIVKLPHHEQRLIRGSFIDITRRKEVEAALRESASELKAIYENAPLVMLLLDQDRRVRKINVSAASMARRPAEASLGIRLGEVFRCIHASDDPKGCGFGYHCADCLLRNTVMETFQKNKAFYRVEAIIPYESPNEAGDMNVLVSTTPLSISGERLVLVCLEDITDRKKMEAHLLRIQKMESIGNLAGGIAHDFNNLLSPIIGLSELLLDDLDSGSAQHENVQEILKAGKRGAQLVKQILAFSRQSEPKKISIQIQKILKEALKLSHATIPSNIEIIQDIQPNCGIVEADPTQIHQIAMNLITNAYHAVEGTNGKISIMLKEKELGFDDLKDISLDPGRYAVLSVMDTGPGIVPTVISKIFEPYFTTKAQGKGTGLGLAVVYGIVKENHGDIKVSTEAEKGTTFSVYLPILEKSADVFPVKGTEPHGTGNERILLVDDEEPVARMEKQILERAGYRTTSLMSSVEALEIFKADPDAFDLVITDMTMPNMTGIQLAEALISIRSNIPIIICSGFNVKLTKSELKSAGIKGFLKKPVAKSHMGRMVRDVLDEAKLKP